MENVFTAAKPLINLAQILGLFPMSFEGPQAKGIFKTKIWTVALTVMWLIIHMSLVVPSINFSTYFDQDSKVLPNAWKFCIILKSFSFCINFLYQTSYKRSIVEFLEKLHETDDRIC
jgi:hypothetical protein